MIRIGVRLTRLFAISFFALAFSLPASADDEPEVSGTRTGDGYVVKKGAYVAIPDDMKMKRVAGNVIKPEEEDFYVARKIDAVQDELTGMKINLGERLEKIDKRLEGIEDALSKQKKKEVAF